MNKQLSLFDPPPSRPLVPRDPNVADHDVSRLTGQNAAILRRLRMGPATNDELARISRKYTSRISDLRAAGVTITAEHRSGGLWLYRIKV